MFGREFQAGEHRQHVVPSPPTGYGFEKVGAAPEKTANAFDELSDFLGDSFSGKPSVEQVKEYLQFETDYPSPDVGSVSNLAEELEGHFGYDLSEFRTGSRKEARPSESDLLSIVKGIAVSVGFSNARSMKNYDGSYFASLGRDYELFITPTGRDNGYDWSVERKGSGVVREGYGMTSQEIVEDIRGSGVVASRTPPTGYGFEKAGYESLRTADSYQFGGGWSAKIVYENDDEGEYAEAILTGPGGAEEIIYPGDGRTFEPGELEDEARQLISEYGDSPYEDTYQYNSSHREASRQETASHHLAFFDGFDIPEPRHRVAGWDWDDHLNGFLAAEAAREFTCACGESVPAPGYTDCRCGRRWNAYTISANGSKRMIAREVPVRDGVVMAGRTASRKTAGVPDGLLPEDVLSRAIDVFRSKGELDDWWEDKVQFWSDEEVKEILVKHLGDGPQGPGSSQYQVGDRVQINGDPVSGTVLSINPSNNEVDIQWDDGERTEEKPAALISASRKQAGAGDWVQAYDGANEWKCKTNPRLYILEEDDGYYLFDNIELIEVTHTLEQAIELGESSHVASRKQGKESWDEWSERMKRQDAEGTGYGSVPGWHLDLPDESPGDEDIDNPDYENPGRF